jgi:hypothetical protein
MPRECSLLCPEIDRRGGVISGPINPYGKDDAGTYGRRIAFELRLNHAPFQFLFDFFIQIQYTLNQIDAIILL